jgi:hypothetical protein
MKKTMKSLVLLLAATGLACTRMFAADDSTASDAKPKPARATELFGDSVVAKGKGVEIKRSELDDEVIRVK